VSIYNHIDVNLHHIGANSHHIGVNLQHIGVNLQYLDVRFNHVTGEAARIIANAVISRPWGGANPWRMFNR
jgi:hypothetical protein